MIEAYKKMWINAFNFKDRTSRSDFWYAYLANILVAFICGLVLGFIDSSLSSIVSSLYSIAIIIPSLSMEIRRLHDVNRSGWFLLMSLIPLIGWIFVLVAYCSKTVEPNNYGKQV